MTAAGAAALRSEFAPPAEEVRRGRLRRVAAELGVPYHVARQKAVARGLPMLEAALDAGGGGRPE